MTLFKPQTPLLGTSDLPTDFRTARTTTKGHGRLEVRQLTASTALHDYLDWPHHAQVFRLEPTVTTLHSKQISRHVTFGITSLDPLHASPARLLSLFRTYWGVENGLHYRRDVTLHEDHTRTASHAFAYVLASLNSLIVGLAYAWRVRPLPALRRFYAAALLSLLSPSLFRP